MLGNLIIVICQIFIFSFLHATYNNSFCIISCDYIGLQKKCSFSRHKLNWLHRLIKLKHFRLMLYPLIVFVEFIVCMNDSVIFYKSNHKYLCASLILYKTPLGSCTYFITRNGVVVYRFVVCSGLMV